MIKLFVSRNTALPVLVLSLICVMTFAGCTSNKTAEPVPTDPAFLQRVETFMYSTFDENLNEQDDFDFLVLPNFPESMKADAKKEISENAPPYDAALSAVLWRKWSKVPALIEKAKLETPADNKEQMLKILRLEGIFYVYHREIGKAAETYRQAAKLAPENITLQTTAGMLSLFAGQAEPALEIFRKLPHQSDLEYATQLLWRGKANLYLGHVNEAEQDLDKALSMLKTTPEDRHLRSEILNEVVKLKYVLGREREAAEILPDAYETQVKLLGVKHPLLTDIKVSLAQFYIDQNLLEAAETILVEAWKIANKTLGLKHPYVLRLNLALGILYRAAGKIEAAKKELSDMYQYSNDVLGPGHLLTLRGETELGGLMLSEGKLEDAKHFLEDAQKNAEKSLGADHYQLAQIYFLLGELYYREGKFKEAADIFGKGVTITEKVRGEKHLYNVGHLNTYAQLLEKAGRMQEAQETRKRLEELEKKLGK